MFINPEFELGSFVVTQTIDERMKRDAAFRDFVYTSIKRYSRKDWGEMSKEDLAKNDEAVLSGDERIFASYKRPGAEDEKIWIITEWDRSVTTVLFPEDY